MFGEICVSFHCFMRDPEVILITASIFLFGQSLRQVLLFSWFECRNLAMTKRKMSGEKTNQSASVPEKQS